MTPQTSPTVNANPRFANALERRAQAVPPIWLMRQAGRYHQHYQRLRARYSFLQLCQEPELAAQVALGPVQDFGFDTAILFSDLLFPLAALGMGLEYPVSGPQLGWRLTPENIGQLRPLEEAWPAMQFQGRAVRATREILPPETSLVGFVGGPWTLFGYAVEGSHQGVLAPTKRNLPLFPQFGEILLPLLLRNIADQLDNGAELVMIFDTAAGELPPDIFAEEVVPLLARLALAFPGRLGYYAKGVQPAHLRHPLFTGGGFAGIGVDYRWTLPEAFALFPRGFVQGNFDPALLLLERGECERRVRSYLATLKDIDRTGWVCGLGHGVLPKTPEDNVRMFVNTVREIIMNYEL